MGRLFSRLIAAGFLIVIGTAGVWYYKSSTAVSHQIAKLEAENKVLTQVVQRLSDEKRVAEVLVTDQKIVQGTVHSTLLFVEYDKAGKSLPPRRFDVTGDKTHFDALVIKFDRHFISEGDPLRGKSIALFTRVYGDQQSPAQGSMIDAPGKVPDIYRGSDPQLQAVETELWQNFWKLADDADFREKMGVRVANGQGVWGPFEPEKLYTITLESDGGLNIASEPLKGIYRELLHDHEPEVH